MRTKIPLLILVAVLCFPAAVGAGEIVKRSYTTAEGKKVTGYVYKSSKSSSSRASGSRRGRVSSSSYPAYRSHGYVVRGYGFAGGSGAGCVPRRRGVETTRTNITYNAACPTTVGRARVRSSGITVFRRR